MMVLMMVMEKVVMMVVVTVVSAVKPPTLTAERVVMMSVTHWCRQHEHGLCDMKKWPRSESPQSAMVWNVSATGKDLRRGSSWVAGTLLEEASLGPAFPGWRNGNFTAVEAGGTWGRARSENVGFEWTLARGTFWSWKSHTQSRG